MTASLPVEEGTTRPEGVGTPQVEFLDTNPVVRYLVRDDPRLAARATALIESDRRLSMSIVTVAEIGFVLMSVYQIERPKVVEKLIDLLNRENIETHEVPTEIAIQALQFCLPSGRVNFGDAMLWASARAVSPARIWTFDKRFPDDGIERRDP